MKLFDLRIPPFSDTQSGWIIKCPVHLGVVSYNKREEIVSADLTLSILWENSADNKLMKVF